MNNIFKFNILIICSIVFSSPVSAQEKQVATTLPITQALSESLLKGTPVNSIYLPPKRLPVKRVSNWLNKKSEARIKRVGPLSAVVTVESIWPQYAAYGKLRTHNIHVIPIDVAQELNEPGSRVRMNTLPEQTHHYFWLAPDNLVVMGQILARDLSRIWPEHAAQIKLNLQQLLHQIQTFSLRLDQLLLDHEVTSVCMQTPDLTPLAEAMFLPVEKGDHCKRQALNISKHSHSVQAVSMNWNVNPAEKPLKKGIEAWLKDNFSRLKNALNTDHQPADGQAVSSKEQT